MSVKILYGARIAPSRSVPTSAGAADYSVAKYKWEVGDVLTIDPSNETLEKADNTTTGPIGLAQEYRREVTGTDYSVDQTYASLKGSLIMDETYLETDRYASGASFTAGNDLYIDANGLVTETGGALKIGKVIEVGSAEITMLFSPQY